MELVNTVAYLSTGFLRTRKVKLLITERDIQILTDEGSEIIRFIDIEKLKVTNNDYLDSVIDTAWIDLKLKNGDIKKIVWYSNPLGDLIKNSFELGVLLNDLFVTNKNGNKFDKQLILSKIEAESKKRQKNIALRILVPYLLVIISILALFLFYIWDVYLEF